MSPRLRSPRTSGSASGSFHRALQAVLFLAAVLGPAPARAQNAIVLENALAGNPSSEWDVAGAGDASIQGYATDVSVDQGGTIEFRIDTDATSYRIDIYRLGWYGGLGARKVATVLPSATLPQAQPACITDPATGLVDCGNWAASASWNVPASATSGVYIAKLVRTDPEDGRASHIAFVVRDDDGGSAILFQTSETTWQAYNTYGGNSFYQGAATSPSAARAHKISFNRPYSTRGGPLEDWVFNAEYPMIRWLERNGYDVSYSTDTDSDRRGAEILEHQVFLSVGHDEYWSAGQRASVVAARDAGVHLAFLSGNEIYWKTRWEASVDGSGTPYRTLVCYKEGTLGENNCSGKCDPLADSWTGLWRDGCSFTPPADGCDPENAVSGQISWMGTTDAIRVPGAHAPMRLWRHTSIAALLPAQEAVLSASTLGYEWDFEQYPASYPAGRVHLSQTVSSGQTHRLALYRASSGALVFGAGTVQWSWGLDGTHDRGASTPDLRMQQMTVNLLAEMGSQPGTPHAGLVPVTPTGDATAPVSAIGFPLDGGTVAQGVTTTISGTASEASGVVGAVEVSVDGGASWARATGGASWSYAWTPSAAGSATIRVRAADDLANLETPGPGVTVTVDPAPPPSCPCTVFLPSETPAGSGNDGQPIELGMRFRSLVDGDVTGVRFYKHVTNTGTHTGTLWTAGGSPLATVTFTGETASGWQEAAFSAPVAITSGTTYVISVFSAGGGYAFSGGFFTTALERAPLRALADGEDGANGVYRFGSAGFPTSTFNSANYWVDLVFETASGPDVTPPSVTAIAPGNGASGVSVTANVTATFSEPMDAGTLDAATVELLGPGATPVAATVGYDAPSRTVTLDPVSSLAYSTLYTASIRGGGTDPRAKDLAGNALAATQSWSFTTAAPPPPPPTEGPGGPILVVTDAGDPFGRYFAEILRAEGLNAFAAMDVSLVTPAVLASHDVVILASMALAAAQVTMLSDWVDAGGNLIAMRPDAQLAPLLGLASPAGTLSNAYLLASGAGPAAGIVGQTIQFHGAADRWSASGATVLATLYSDATTATSHPAVTLRSVGANGGQAACFTYDLARSVVYTRQGNPAWAGQERDAPEGAVAAATLRATDMFYGNAPGDPQPDWIDLGKVAIPQADEQQRLLANLILSMNLDRKPLPRFWYLPKGKKAAVIMTGDNHGDGGMASRFQAYVDQSPPGCSPGDWECVRASGYLYVSGGFTDAQAIAFHNQGFEIGVHVNTGCANWTEPSLRNDYDTQLATFAAAYPSLPGPSTNRTHCGAWSDWATQARVQSEKGIRLDTNYYYWPPTWILDRSGMFTGSGMPMRFADLDGTIIDCYQAPTQMTDESGQSYPATVNSLLDRAIGPEGYYGAFCANMHFDSSPHAGSDLIVAAALARGVPVVSGRQMLEWLDGRNGSSFGGLSFGAGALSFTVSVGAGASNLRGMLPLSTPSGALVALTRDATPVAWTTETIKGIAYAFFPASAGAWVATYAPDTQPPAISNVTATPAGNGATATVSWDTDEPADSRVDYGTDAGSLLSSVSSATQVTSHSLVLTGLTPGTTYHFRVSSADLEANAATSPEPPAAPLTFVTPTPPCAADDALADFGAGTTGAGTHVARELDGEVILAPVTAAEFESPGLPAGWTSIPWSGGGSSSVAGGSLTVDGAYTGPPASFGPGTSLEFEATFGAATFQHVGLSDDFNSAYMIFSTFNTTSTLYARTNGGGDTPLPGVTIGSPHRFRIDWNGGSVVFSVDGAVVATHGVAIATPSRALVSDFAPGGPGVSVAWLRVLPYASSGSFTSRVFDAGGSVSWGAMTWSAQTPAGTSLAMAARTGSTPVPDGTWMTFSPVPSSGSPVGLTGRYLQYRADLATTDAGRTPVLEDVAVSCTPAGPDVTPPAITNVQAVPAGTNATVTWDTDEPADSRVDHGPTAALGTSVSSASLATSHSLLLGGLSPSTTYHYRVTSADAAANTAESPVAPATLTFTTAAATCAADDSDVDFGAGSTAGGTYVSRTAEGEVILAPTVGAEFEGSSLPVGFGTFSWSGGGGSTVSGGQVSIDGHRLNSLGPEFGPGRTLEFVATFAAATFQHVGLAFGSDLPPGEMYNNTHFAAFSTGAQNTELRARSGNGGAVTETSLGPLLGTPHRYRIVWDAASVSFYVDDALVATHATAIPGPMRPAASDFAEGGAVLTVDWLRMSPHGSPGTFDSRVFDGGGPVSWGTMSWTAATPAGTAVSMSVRGGEDPDPGHPSWSAFQPVATSGQSLGLCSRYLQYRAVLTSSDPAVSPSLEDVTVTCSPGATLTSIGDLAVAPSAGLPDASGRTRIALTWSAPGGGGPVQVYRKGYGDYPLYRVGIGMVPSAPASPAQAQLDGWTLTAVSASGQEDQPPARDFWYYVAFDTNVCGQASAVSNLAGGMLDYVLGDVSDGSTACEGDNYVTLADVSLLGFHYGRLTSEPLVPTCLDVGPTVGGSRTGRPLPDGLLAFEDLVIVALNYAPPPGPGPLAKRPAPPVAAPASGLALRATDAGGADGTLVAIVRATGAGDVRAVSLTLDYDRAVLEWVRAEAGELLARQSSPGVALSPGPGQVDVALLGGPGGLCGEGDLVRIEFRRRAAGDPKLALARTDARDAANRNVSLDGAPRPQPVALPTVTGLSAARPNPFGERMAIAFRLAQAGPVDLAVYAVDGRRVRTIVHEEREPGEYEATWDGRDDGGNLAGTGIYYVRLITRQGRFVRRVTFLR